MRSYTDFQVSIVVVNSLIVVKILYGVLLSLTLNEFRSVRQASVKLMHVLRPYFAKRAIFSIVNEVHGHLHADKIGRKECVCSHDRIDAQFIRELHLHCKVCAILLEVLFV